MSLSKLPRAQAPIAGATPPTSEWWAFLRSLAEAVGTIPNAEVIATINQKIADLEAQEQASFNLIGPASVEVQGSPSAGTATLVLVNDSDVPASTNYYGTDATGAKGFHAVSDSVTAENGIQKIVDTDGVSTFSPTGNLASVHGLTTVGIPFRNSDIDWQTRVFNVSGDASITDDGSSITITIAAFPPELGYAGV